MTKIILQRMVKYNGEKIPANVAFEVEEKDLAEFQEMGCHVFEEPQEETKKTKTKE